MTAPISGLPISGSRTAAVTQPLAGRVVTFTSSNGAVAAAPAAMTTDVNGQVAPVLSLLAAGTTNIQATCEGHVSNLSVVTAQAAAAVATLAVTPTPISGLIGASVLLTAVAKDAGGNALFGRTITWSTSDASVVSVGGGVGQTLTVNFLKAGTANIIAHCEGINSNTVVATVSAPGAPAATVTVAPTSLEGLTGGTAQLTATVLDGSGNVLTGRVITWASSAPGIAGVTSP